MAKETKKDTNMLSDIGIEVSNDKIAIDTAKTKEFFGNIQQHIQDTAQNIGEHIEKGTQNAGIKVDDEHIEVDLQQTKNFIEEMGEKIEHFLAHLEHSVDKLSKK
ncbi:MAG: hypothetical protein PHI02_06625 [Sulfurovaceae bacterium]|nr:hypothetical protein [Sulfurovaceae bacterium]